MRSVLVAVYELRANEIFVVGHHDCGMSHLDPAKTIEKMVARGIARESACARAGRVSGAWQRWRLGVNGSLSSVPERVVLLLCA